MRRVIKSYKTSTTNINKIKPGRPKKPIMNAFMELSGKKMMPHRFKVSNITAPNSEDKSSLIYHLTRLLNNQQQSIIKIIPAIKPVIISAYNINYVYSAVSAGMQQENFK